MSATIERRSASPSRRPRATANRESGRRDSGSSNRPRLTALLSPRAAATVAFGPAGIALLLVALVIVLTLVGSGSDLSGLSGAIGATWLVVHLAPIEISGSPLSAAPILPAVLVAWSVARLCRRVARDGDRSVVRISAILGCAIGGPVLLALALYALVLRASAVAPLAPGSLLASIAAVALVHAVGSMAGVWPIMWPATVEWLALPSWMGVAGRGARSGAVVFAAAAAVLTAVLVALSTDRIGAMFAAPIGLLGVIGVAVLSVFYLPTVLVGVVAVLVGSSVRVGDVDVSLFAATGGEQPIPLPIMAVVPNSAAAGWWPLLVIISAVSAVRVGMVCARNLPDRVTAIKAVALAAVGTGLVAGFLGWLGGGAAGSRVEVHIGALGLAGGVAGWWLVVGAATVALLFHLGDDFLGAADPIMVAQRAGRALDGGKKRAGKDSGASGAHTTSANGGASATAESGSTATPKKVDLKKADTSKRVDLTKATATSKTTEPKTPESKATEPKTTEPKTTEPKTTEPKATEPKTPEPKTPEPKTPAPKTGKSAATESKTTGATSAEPKTSDATKKAPVEKASGTNDGPTTTGAESAAESTPSTD